MNRSHGGFVSGRVEAKHHRSGEHSLFAADRIVAGEVVAAWSGEIVSYERVVELGVNAGKTLVQIDEDLYLESSGVSISDWINHSCDPNLGMRGQIVLVARRVIARGEELCFDYAMTDGTAYDEFDCECRARACRKRITGDDWRLPELQHRYRGYFSPYLSERIARASVAA